MDEAAVDHAAVPGCEHLVLRAATGLHGAGPDVLRLLRLDGWHNAHGLRPVDKFS